jgi:hypothetical protein
MRERWSGLIYARWVTRSRVSIQITCVCVGNCAPHDASASSSPFAPQTHALNACFWVSSSLRALGLLCDMPSLYSQHTPSEAAGLRGVPWVFVSQKSRCVFNFKSLPHTTTEFYATYLWVFFSIRALGLRCDMPSLYSQHTPSEAAGLRGVPWVFVSQSRCVFNFESLPHTNTEFYATCLAFLPLFVPSCVCVFKKPVRL